MKNNRFFKLTLVLVLCSVGVLSPVFGQVEISPDVHLRVDWDDATTTLYNIPVEAAVWTTLPLDQISRIWLNNSYGAYGWDLNGFGQGLLAPRLPSEINIIGEEDQWLNEPLLELFVEAIFENSSSFGQVIVPITQSPFPAPGIESEYQSRESDLHIYLAGSIAVLQLDRVIEVVIDKTTYEYVVEFYTYLGAGTHAELGWNVDWAGGNQRPPVEQVGLRFSFVKGDQYKGTVAEPQAVRLFRNKGAEFVDYSLVEARDLTATIGYDKNCTIMLNYLSVNVPMHNFEWVNAKALETRQFAIASVTTPHRTEEGLQVAVVDTVHHAGWSSPTEVAQYQGENVLVSVDDPVDLDAIISEQLAESVEGRVSALEKRVSLLEQLVSEIRMFLGFWFRWFRH